LVPGISQAKQIQGAERSYFLANLVKESGEAAKAVKDANSNSFTRLWGATDSQAQEIGDLAQLLADNTRALAAATAARRSRRPRPRPRRLPRKFKHARRDPFAAREELGKQDGRA
jgi:hypothetical protein